MQSEFSTLGFHKFIDTANTTNLKEFFGKQDRTGVYILHFTNGEYYVGLTTDIVKRFVQHRHHFLDIQYLSFKEVSSSELLDEEKDVVYSLEKLGKKFRDVSIEPTPITPSMLDKVISPKEQENWLDYEVPVDVLKEGRIEVPLSRSEDSAKFNEITRSRFFEKISQLFKSYILQAVPFPGRTELQYWCSSCKPESDMATITISSEQVVIVRKVSINSEIRDKVNLTGVDVCFLISKSKLFKNYSQQQLERKFPTIEPEDSIWHPGRQDQQTIWMDINDAIEFLDDADCLDAIKESNLRLMRKGVTLSAWKHCAGLAGLAFDSAGDRVQIQKVNRI